MIKEDLIYEILSVVEEIPEGRVASYGQIARLIGRDKNSRLVGKVLSMAEYYGRYPCHPGGEPRRANSSGLEGAETPSGGRGSGVPEKRVCGYETVSVGCVILHKLNKTCDCPLPLLDKVITESKEKINFEKLS